MSCCPRPDDTPLHDREMPSCEDLDRFGGDDIACPNCGSDVYHDATQCHVCGHAMTDASVSKGMPGWVPLAAVLVVAGIVLGFVGWML